MGTMMDGDSNQRFFQQQICKVSPIDNGIYTYIVCIHVYIYWMISDELAMAQHDSNLKHDYEWRHPQSHFANMVNFSPTMLKTIDTR